METPTTTQRTAPVFLIGLDALDPVLLRRWAEQGLLPNIARLLDHGAGARVTGACRAMQGSIWPTVTTARNPGEHGMYYMLQPRPGSHRLHRVRADDLQAPPFWQPLDAVGKRCLIIDVPKLGLCPGACGIQVVEWGAMDHYSRFAVHPRPLRSKLLATYGRHVLQDRLVEPRTAADHRSLRDGLIAGAAAKTRLLTDLIIEHQPDFVFCVYGEAHPAGHYFWRFHRQSESPSDLGAALRQVYTALDQAIGTLHERFAASANLLFFSGHGMLSDHYPRWLMPPVLRRMGLTVEKGDASRQHRKLQRPITRLATPPGRAGAAALRLPRLRQLANRYLIPYPVQQRLWLRNLQRHIDFARSRAWALPSDLQGYVRINQIGREPGGIVVPDDTAALLDRIDTELTRLIDAETASPVVRETFRPCDCYPDSPERDRLPDLCVLWHNAPVRRVHSPTLGEFEAPAASNHRSGNHRPEGIIIAVGPDMPQGAGFGDVDLLDIGPTVLALLGVPIPVGLTGTPLCR